MTFKNTLSFIAILLISQIALSQTLKTYTGYYEGGEATYQYYETADYERIFQGKFSYKSTNDNPAAYNSGRVYQDITITGNFKENKKDGLWEGKQVLTSQAGNFAYGNANVTTIVKGNYSNGLKTGIWTYKQNSILDKKTEMFNYSFNFNNNVLVGTLAVNNLNGTLDNQGNFTGNWNLKSGENEYIAEFQNNIFVKLIVRKVSDGSILLKYINTNITTIIKDSLAIIDGTRYILQNVKDLDKYDNNIEPKSNNNYNDEKNKYFTDFYNIIAERIGSFDNTIDKINLGSNSFLIISPKVPVVKELTYQEKREIEEEKQRIENERLAAIARKQKFDETVSNANQLFENKKYKEALVKYNSANAIEYSDDISAKIKSTQSQIDRIESLQKKRYETYLYIKNKSETIKSEMTNLNISLSDKKKSYGKNYEACMNLLSTNFDMYSSRVNTLFSTNKTTGLTIEDSWNDADQEALDVLLKFKEELAPYEKFHYAVKTAYDTDNKDKLKLLNYSENPSEIISKF